MKTFLRKTVLSLLGVALLLSNATFSTQVNANEEIDFVPSVEVVNITEVYNPNRERLSPHPSWSVETEYYDDGGITRRYFDSQGYMVALEILFPEYDGIVDPFSAPMVMMHDQLYDIMVQSCNTEWYYRHYRVQLEYHIRAGGGSSYFTWMHVTINTGIPPSTFPPGRPSPVFILNAARGQTIQNRHTAWATFSLPNHFPNSTERRFDWTVLFGNVTHTTSSRWIR